MKVYSTFDKDNLSNWSQYEYKPYKYDAGDKLVDDSKYRPNQPLLKQVNGSCSECLNYDFPDGQIDESLGRQMAFIRQRGLTASEFNAYLESLQYLSAEQKSAMVDELKQTVKQKLQDKAIENLAKESKESAESNSTTQTSK